MGGAVKNKGQHDAQAATVLKKNDSLEKPLRFKLFIVLFFYILAGYLFMMGMQYAFPFFQNPVTEYLYWRLDVIYFLYLVIGMACIFYYYWKKPWCYLEEVIRAAQIVYDENENPIALPEPLHEVEKQMNGIKMSMLISRQAAKEAEDKKNELVMYLAHDIRTPLTTVIGYLSLLEEAPDMPKVQREKYVGTALKKAERLETLINEMFEITRYHTNRIRLDKRPVDLHALLSQVIDDFYPVLTKKGNTIKMSAESSEREGLTAEGDAEKLARVFHNLLKNAVSYSDAGTEIRILAEKRDQHVVILFENQGTEIPKKELEMVFEKFHRLSEARVSDTGGTGLGLSIAREIVRLHGGEITAESSGRLVRFTIVLPCKC